MQEEIRQAAEQLHDALCHACELSSKPNDGPVAQRLVTTGLDDCLRRLSLTGLWGEANRLPSSLLWQTAGDMLSRGELQLRARTKPRGFAGDDVMLTMIHEQTCCDDPLGKCFDTYFQSQQAPQAVRGRIRLSAQWLVDHILQSSRSSYQVASIGCGPAIEIDLALNRLPANRDDSVRAVLYDLDQEALDRVEQRLGRKRTLNSLDLIQGNLFRLPRNHKLAEPLAESDSIFCLGLFDYLDDDGATALLSLMWRSLRAGGMLVVGNFAPHCTSRAYMEWIANWYLIYRTTDEMAALASAAGIPAQYICLASEPLGVDLLLTATKP